MRPTRRRWWLVVGAAVFTALLAACSLLVEQRDKQCEKDADCAKFTDAVCDTVTHVCVSSSRNDGGDCKGDTGCYACTPHDNVDFLNACTEASCAPFDNGKLKKLLTADGGLPALP